MLLTRSTALLAALLGCVTTFAQVNVVTSPEKLPILFVHGNGDDAARWIPTIWLFESNGYPADRLFAIRFTRPAARTDDTHEEPNRSSTIDAAAELAAEVTRTLIETHSRKVILIGSSRGGMTIRNYLKNGGGAPNVAIAILCGTPNHGVVASDTNPQGEFNGRGAFLTALNNPSADGSETIPGVRMMTLRSDKLDKYAQPTAIIYSRPQDQTGVSFEGPALKGATNLVLKGEDHRELAFSRTAFAKMFDFITGHPPLTTQVTPEQHPSLSGLVTGFAFGAPTNQPLGGVHLRIYAVASTAVAASPSYETTTTPDGRWGPFLAEPNVEYEFDLEANDNAAASPAQPQAVPRHVRYFVSSLPRSTHLWNLRFLPAPREPSNAGGMFLASRPQGYFSRERDLVTFNGKPSEEEPSGLPTRDSFVFHSSGAGHLVEVTMRQETMKVQLSSDLALDLPIAFFLW